MRSIFILAFALALASPAFATDGVAEINQTCAAQTGCFPGDTAGFPVDITQPGSYRLTGSLAAGNVFIPGITISASEVTLDLNGFAITNNVTCSGLGSTVTCNVSSSSRQGIDATDQARVTVRNGTIRGFAGGGIKAGDYADISDIHVEQTGGSGIWTGAYASVSNSTTAINGAGGVIVATSSEVIGVVARSNGNHGITAGNGSIIKNVRAWDNGGNGFELAFGIVMTDSTAYINEGRWDQLAGRLSDPRQHCVCEWSGWRWLSTSDPVRQRVRRERVSFRHRPPRTCPRRSQHRR
jgi:hypothetical protein